MQVLSTRVDLFSKPFGAYVRDNQITDLGGIKQYRISLIPVHIFGYGGFSCIAFAMNIDVIGLLSLSVAWGTLIDFEFCRSQSKSRPAKIVLPNFDKSAGQLTSSRCSNDSKGDIWGVTWEAVTICDNGFSNRQNYEATIGDNPFATSW